MDISSQSKRTVYSCYLTYFMSGVVILCFGAIMPELITQKGINYTLAGGLLTCLTIGNFISTMLYPALCARIEEKYVTVALCCLYPVCLFLFTIVGSLAVLYVLIFLIGLNRGIITLTNNRTVNAATGNSPKHLNLLHMCYAVGALLSPFLIALLTKAGISWETILRGIALITIAIPVLYAFVDKDMVAGKSAEVKGSTAADADAVNKAGSDNADGNDAGGNNAGSAKVFLKVAGYWLVLGMIFCYMGLENTVNGWFETYLKQRGIMSDTMATMMVSVTWAMIMIGRIAVASLAGKIKTSHILSAITVIQLIAVILLLNADTGVMVVISLVIFGFGLAGIYPTLMAYTGDIVNNSNLGMSILTGCGAIGGMLLPQLIGIVADASGFDTAIVLMLVNSIILVVLGVLTIFESKKRLKKEGI